MIRKTGVAYSILGLLLLGAFLGISQPADAASGSITIAPGETKYLSFGSCSVGDLLFWDLEISTLSTIFECWLQTPTGVHLSLYSLTWGEVVDVPGEWKFGFSIDSSGWWSATVYYTMYRTTPHVEITSPLDSSYVNQQSITVTGTVDLFATEVELSIDHVHYVDADLYLGNWNKVITLPSDGEYTVYAEGTVIWCGIYSVKYYDSVSVTLDTVTPEVGITAPTNNSYVAGTIDLAWQCSDESGIALAEVKIDLLDWNTVDGSEYSCDVSDGEHTAKVRVTDVAGNSAIVAVTVISDTVAPTIALTSPVNNSYIAGTLDISWQCSDECGIALTEVKVDSLDWLTVTGSQYDCELPDGSHTVNVRVTDFAGNSAVATVTIVSDTVAPTVTLVTPVNNSYIAGTLDISWQCSDEYGVALTEVKVDLLDWVTVTGSQYDCELPDGSHTVKVRVTDFVGNSAEATVTVVSDTVAPTVSLVAPANNSCLAGELELTWQCSDECGIALREVKVDHLDWMAVDGSEYNCELSDGSHTVKVRVTDLAGNTAITSATVTSDTVKPQVAVTSPYVNSKISKDSLTISWTGSDALSGIDHYDVRISSGGGWIEVVDVGLDTSYTFTGLQDKWYSVTVRAVDKSGNSAESSVSVGIYTSIWSTNGPYDGIPLFALIAAAAIVAALSVLLYRRKRGGAAADTVPEETAPESVRKRVLAPRSP